MPRGMSSIGDALRTAISRSPVADELGSYPLWTDWAAIVGAPIARHARPRRLRGNVLVVAVDGPDWIHELRFLADDLRARMNARLGRPVIRELYFVLAGDR
jgi:predicted nucleic acid-binding Zn ribbon protein